MNFTQDQTKEIIKKVIENDFYTNDDENLMFVVVDGQTIKLHDDELKGIMNYEGCTVKERVTIAKGMTAEEFYKDKGVYTGYRLFDIEQHPEYKEGAYIEDPKKHGIYFTIKKEELFRFILASYFEKFGAHIAEISFKDGSKFLENAAIAKGYDTDGTYRAHCFYIEKVYSVNNYRLIMDLFKISPVIYKIMICDNSEKGFFNKSIEYYRKKGCDETVAALCEIHNNYHL